MAEDVAVLETEVTPTLNALRAHRLDVVAIHHHMITSKTVIMFLHYWGRRPADKLVTGFKAVNELGKKQAIKHKCRAPGGMRRGVRSLDSKFQESGDEAQCMVAGNSRCSLRSHAVRLGHRHFRDVVRDA